MALSTAVARPAPGRASSPARSSAPARGAASVGQRPRLAVVARPAPQRSVLPFVALCSLIAVAALASVLFLNIRMSDTSYEITRLQTEAQALREQTQTLQEQEDRFSTPQELQRRALELGMVPTGSPVYIDLATGEVIGDGQPVAPQPAPGASVIPPAQIYGQTEPYYGMGNEGN